MPTEAQIRANKANAQRSTGPTSVEGKQRSRFNAVKHALTATFVVLPKENLGDYYELQGALLKQYQPECPGEMFLVDQIAQNWWRLNRCRRFETGTLAKLEAQEGEEGVRHEDLELLRRYEASVTRSYYRAYEHMEKIVRRRPLVAKSEDPRDLFAPPRPERQPEPTPEPEPVSQIKEAAEVNPIGFVSQNKPATPEIAETPISDTTPIGFVSQIDAPGATETLLPCPPSDRGTNPLPPAAQ